MSTQPPAQPARSRKLGAPTLTDVARLAKVSPMTVSRVVNNTTPVSARSRAAVDAAIASLGYTPNFAARALAGTRPARLGILCRDLGAGFMSEMLIGCFDSVGSAHAQIIIENSAPDTDPLPQLDAMIRDGIDGIVLPPPLSEHGAVIDLIDREGVPAVALTASLPDPRVLAVHIDDHAAALRMTRHLIDLGHRRIGFITGAPALAASGQRLAGYRDALHGAGLGADPALVADGLFTYRSGLAAAERLLSLPSPPTAIFASNDDMAAATVAVAHRSGLDVPRDLSVCGFDDTTLATAVWPELTTIRQPIADMARAAIRLLVETLGGAPGTQPPVDRRRVFAFDLVRRQSCGRPGEGPETG